MKDTATLLHEWRQLRIKLQENFTEDNLQDIITWWRRLETHVNGFDFDRTESWTDVWQYVADGFFTKSGNGLACFMTLCHSCPDKEPELWLVHDLLHTNLYLITYVDGYVLNRSSGELEKYEDVKSDIDILTKHTKDSVLQAIKYNNQGK